MKRIATLGPAGTFSDIATKQYLKNSPSDMEIVHCSSIGQVLSAASSECELAVLPIENFSEGYVSLVLDHIMASELSVVQEIILPVRFSCIGNTEQLLKIKKLWVQFVARGQCSEFIDDLSNQLPNLEVITTETNMVSYQKMCAATESAAAIVPVQTCQSGHTLLADTVNDFANNQTRFFVLSKQPPAHDSDTVITRSESKMWKTSFVINDDEDRPGLLAEILNCFAKRNVNLTSIVSRPTKVRFGSYRFMIDIEGHIQQSAVTEAVNEISALCEVKILGSYPAAVVTNYN